MQKRITALWRKQQGFTLIEGMIATTLLLVIVGVATGVIFSNSRNQAQIQAENVMRSQAQTALFRLTAKMNQTRMLMGNDALGNAYRSHLQMTSTPAPLPSPLTALPTIRPQGSLSPEKNCTEFPNSYFRANAVGNSLLFSRYLGKFSDFGFAEVQKQRALDIYEFKYIYITEETKHSPWFVDNRLSSTPDMKPRRLIEWTSVKYVDYDQFNDYIADMAGADRTTIRSRLSSSGINHAWRRSGTTYNSDIFYAVGTGSGGAISAVANHTIPKRSHLDFLHFDRDIYSVAYNSQPNQTSSDYFPIRNQVPFFYDPNPPACGGELPAPGTTPALNTGFPGGMEVMIVGPPSGRNILVRLTHVALISSSRLVDHADMITAYARDL